MSDTCAVLPEGLSLIQTEKGLTLTDGKLELRGDFTGLGKRLRAENLRRELIVRAARLKNCDHTPTVLDATAGFGEDSFLLAAAGFEVILYEYDPVIAALLEDSLQRALMLSEYAEAAEGRNWNDIGKALLPIYAEAAGRMHPVRGDSIEAMRSLRGACVSIREENETRIEEPFQSGKPSQSGLALQSGLVLRNAPDVIFLDPMFPERQKSALVKKKFQLLQRLEQPCADEEALIGAALEAKPKKVIVKRPVKGAYLGGIIPSYSLTGSTIRYDCYIP